ncbi:hypothetical protein HMPREF3162_04585 [Brevibacterium sp. HMSC07C04]|nr:hypothetical protein HMPREF3162_04585 [Brevibacterium sp. HMSC07C04]
MLHHITRQILTSKRNTVITIMEYAEKTVRLCVANSPPRQMDITDVSNDIPKPLQAAMRRAGFLDPRTNEPSMRQWSVASGVHTTTISRTVRGAAPRPKTMTALADSLGVSVGMLQGMLGNPAEEPWVPPSGTERLTLRQRDALDALILSLVEEPSTTGDCNDTSSSDSQAVGTPSEADEAEKIPAPPRNRLHSYLATHRGERALNAEGEAASRRGEEPHQ